MKRVAILVETALNSGREILGGIARYLHERDDWTVFHHTGPLGATAPASLDQWRGDGIIARIATPALLARVRAKQVPVVDVLGNVSDSPFPLVKSDDARIGRLAAEHFLDSGHRHFAFLGLGDERWSLEREAGFARTLQGRARSCRVLQLQPDDRTARRWQRTTSKVTQFLAGAPTPLGLMVASDQFGPLALEACQRTGLTIPEEVSIVSVDNDQPFCNLCDPRLSSIEPNHQGVGYEAARLLDRILEGATPSDTVIEIPPLVLHRRLSSDATAVSDPSLVRALQFIREHACDGVSVDDVARHAGLSRSVLQRRFRQNLDRTVGDALLQARLRRARDMLTLTDLPLLDVAERTGFNYQEYLTQVFKKHLGVTPARFRLQSRRSAAG